MAELWRLPVVYLIENNQYAMGTSIERSSATTDLSQRGASFNIPGAKVDGMDVLAVREAAQKAAEHARSGKGPYILEMKTYRYRGHSMSDPAKYRTRRRSTRYSKTRDPIDHIRAADGRRRGEGRRDQDDRRRGEGRSCWTPPSSPNRAPSPIRRELYTDVYVEA